VNLELVRRGAAAPYFYRGDRGRYASQLMAAARAARAAKRGLWRALSRDEARPVSPGDHAQSMIGEAAPPASADTGCADARRTRGRGLSGAPC
jgi:Staphylococcal nuclease homologue